MKKTLMQLTRKDVLELHHVLTTTNFDHPIHSRFRYVISNNVKCVKDEVDEIHAAFPPPEGMPKYQQERVQLFAKYGVKTDSEYDELPAETKKSLDDELNKLDEVNKELLEEIQELEKEKIEFLKEPCEVSLLKIHIDYVPSTTSHQRNGLNGWELWSVLELIIEEPEESEERKETSQEKEETE